MNPHSMLQYMQAHHDKLHQHWNRGVKMEEKVQEIAQECFEQHLGITPGLEVQFREINYSTPHPGQGAKPTADLNLVHQRDKNQVRPEDLGKPLKKRRAIAVSKQTFYCVEIKAESPNSRNIPQGGYPEAVNNDINKIKTLGQNELIYNAKAVVVDVARLWVLVFACSDAASSTVFAKIKSDESSYDAVKTFSSNLGGSNKSFITAIWEKVYKKQQGIFQFSASRAHDALTHDMPI